MTYRERDALGAVFLREVSRRLGVPLAWMYVNDWASEASPMHVWQLSIRPFPSRRWLLHNAVAVSYLEERTARSLAGLWSAKVEQAVLAFAEFPAYRNWRNSLKLFRMNGQRWAA